MRLTEKKRFTPFNDYDLNFGFDNGKLGPTGTQQDILNKLGQLEDIEDELGIDLATFFKALKNGVYYFTQGNQLTKDKVMVNDANVSVEYGKTSLCFVTYFELKPLDFKDYGTSWALTKEELL